MRLVEPTPPPSVADSIAALLANESPSSSSLLMIAWIMAGAFAAACACVLLVYMVQTRRRKQRAKLKFGERRPRRKRDVNSGVEMTDDPQAIIAASEAACRELMRDHLDDYARAVGPANVNFKAWIALLHPENVTLDGRMWLEKGEQLMLWKHKFPYDISAEAEARAARRASATRATPITSATPANPAPPAPPASPEVPRLRALPFNAEEHASLPVGSVTLTAVSNSSAAHATLEAARLTAVARPIAQYPAGGAERRIDADGKSYTRQEFEEYYRGQSGLSWEAKWAAAKPIAGAPALHARTQASGGVPAGGAERRIDADGKSYTRQEFEEYYRGQSGLSWEAKWAAAKPIAGAPALHARTQASGDVRVKTLVGGSGLAVGPTVQSI